MTDVKYAGNTGHHFQLSPPFRTIHHIFAAVAGAGRQRVSLSDSVLSVLPELGEYSPSGDITPPAALHRQAEGLYGSGFARKTGFYDPLTPQETRRIRSVGAEADFPRAGTRHDYSSTGYFLLSLGY